MGDIVIPPAPPNGLADIIAHYGDPHVQRDQDGNWTVDPKWESLCCTTLEHPLLPRGKLYMHRLVIAPMNRLLDRWRARIINGDAYRVLSVACFAPRAQRGSNGLLASTHSWAIAFDLNPDTNPLISGIEIDDPRRQKCKDIPDAWIADAKAEGWFWGGEFQHRYDPMHFQMATGY